MRWRCGIYLKDRLRRILQMRSYGIALNPWCWLCRMLYIEEYYVALERKVADDWVSAFRELVVNSVNSKGRDRKFWKECVRYDLGKLGLAHEAAQDSLAWRTWLTSQNAQTTVWLLTSMMNIITYIWWIQAHSLLMELNVFIPKLISQITTPLNRIMVHD